MAYYTQRIIFLYIKRDTQYMGLVWVLIWTNAILKAKTVVRYSGFFGRDGFGVKPLLFSLFLLLVFTPLSGFLFYLHVLIERSHEISGLSKTIYMLSISKCLSPSLITRSLLSIFTLHLNVWYTKIKTNLKFWNKIPQNFCSKSTPPTILFILANGFSILPISQYEEHTYQPILLILPSKYF